MDVRDKVVAITGAARGLGQEFARSLAAAGARVIAADINDCSATLDLVRAEQAEGIAARLDVTDPASARDMVEAAMRAFGRLPRWRSTSRASGTAARRRPAMRQSIIQGAIVQGTGGGSIVNIASLAATYGMPFGLHYTTSKAAVIGLTRGLARELGRDRIRVNALAPSAVITEGTREFFGARMERALETIKSSQTIQRNLMPEDLAGTVLWLISDASGFVTGQTIAVDGGTVML